MCPWPFDALSPAPDDLVAGPTRGGEFSKLGTSEQEFGGAPWAGLRSKADDDLPRVIDGWAFPGIRDPASLLRTDCDTCTCTGARHPDLCFTQDCIIRRRPARSLERELSRPPGG